MNNTDAIVTARSRLQDEDVDEDVDDMGTTDKPETLAEVQAGDLLATNFTSNVDQVPTHILPSSSASLVSISCQSSELVVGLGLPVRDRAADR